jgi:tetratricopeptide (TPR) repeat protein
MSLSSVTGRPIRSLEECQADLDEKVVRFTDKHAETADTYFEKGVILARTGRAEETLRLCDFLEDLYAQIHHKLHANIGLVKVLRSEALETLGRLHDAIQAAESAAKFLTVAVGVEWRDVSGCYFRMGLLHALVGQHAAAEAVFNKAKTIQISCGGRVHPTLSPTLYHLALALQAQGKLREALDVARQCLDARQYQLEPSEADVEEAQALVDSLSVAPL